MDYNYKLIITVEGNEFSKYLNDEWDAAALARNLISKGIVKEENISIKLEKRAEAI